jgi:HSP20 family molecular chaperone IbpA
MASLNNPDHPHVPFQGYGPAHSGSAIRPPSYATGDVAGEEKGSGLDEKSKGQEYESPHPLGGGKPVDLPIHGRGRGHGCGRGRGRGCAGHGARGGIVTNTHDDGLGGEPFGGIRGGRCRMGRGHGREHGWGRGFGRGGRCGRGMGHHGGLHGHGHHGHHGRHGHHGKGWAQTNPGGRFGLPGFLGDLGTRLGFNPRGPANTSNDAGFIPPTDIFDLPARYLVHVSLPGAKKQNIKVEYKPALSVLHVSGTVQRPAGITQKQMDGLVVDGRACELGNFERKIRLGTRLNPANVAADGISSKMADGVLVVILPKKVVDPSRLKKRVSIEEQKKGGEEESDGENGNEKADDEKVLYEYRENEVDYDTETEEGDAKENDPLRDDDGKADKEEDVIVDVK